MSRKKSSPRKLEHTRTNGFRLAALKAMLPQSNTVPNTRSGTDIEHRAQPLRKAHGGARPPDGVVPQSKPDLPRVKPTLGRYPSPPLPDKMWSTVSVHTPPCVGGVNSRNVPHPGPRAPVAPV